MSNRGDLLFTEHDLFAVRENLRQKMGQEINGFDANYLLNVDTDELMGYLRNRYEPNVPQLKEDQITAHQEDTWIEFEDRFTGRTGRVPGTKYTFYIPFEGDEFLFNCQPSTHTYNPPRGLVRNGELELIFERQHGGTSHIEREAESIKTEFNQQLEAVRNYLQWMEQEVRPFNETLINTAKDLIKLRQEKFLKDSNVAAALGLPLRVRTDTLRTFVVPEIRRKIAVPLPSASTAPFVPEPALANEHYEHILNVIQNMVHVMERSPKAFREMDEEDLRWHFLVQLNGHFEGNVSAETFNYEGKTDVLVRVGDRNIFVGECKNWRGQQKFTEAIDQVLGYATWRDTKVALLIFNRNKDLGAVLTQIPVALEQHHNFKRKLAYACETGFRCVLHQRDDKNRELILTVLVFDIPQ